MNPLLRQKDYYVRLSLLILGILYTTQYASSFCIPDDDVSSISTGQEESIKSLNTDSTKRLCPEGKAFHNATSTCQTLLEKGPCGDLQLFYPMTKDSQYGACACMSNEDGCNSIVKSNRMILSGADGKNCYWAFSSGPCPDGQWYVLNKKSMKPECQKNSCYSADGVRKSDSNIKGADEIVLGIGQGGTDKFTFVLNNTCYDTFTKAYCPEGQYAQFFGTNDPIPKCYMVTMGQPMCLFGVAPVVGMPCDAGYKHVGDDCVMENIDFE